jgi:hypothetical protein
MMLVPSYVRHSFRDCTDHYATIRADNDGGFNTILDRTINLPTGYPSHRKITNPADCLLIQTGAARESDIKQGNCSRDAKISKESAAQYISD